MHKCPLRLQILSEIAWIKFSGSSFKQWDLDTGRTHRNPWGVLIRWWALWALLGTEHWFCVGFQVSVVGIWYSCQPNHACWWQLISLSEKEMESCIQAKMKRAVLRIRSQSTVVLSFLRWGSTSNVVILTVGTTQFYRNKVMSCDALQDQERSLSF